MSEKTASSCATTNSGGSSWIAVTAVVFCAVSATSTDMPCAPAAANALRSAWMPAPPPLSDVAIVSARRNCHCAPFAGMTRIRFDGCDLSPEGHPGSARLAPARAGSADHVRLGRTRVRRSSTTTPMLSRRALVRPLRSPAATGPGSSPARRRGVAARPRAEPRGRRDGDPARALRGHARAHRAGRASTRRRCAPTSSACARRCRSRRSR